MHIEIPRVMIAAPASGSGKSVIATGLMAALARSQTVQGFKVGPDYIDPMYHTAATGRPSRNLDTWMAPAAAVRASFARAVAGAEIAVIEGVMGLYDGFDGRSESGSSAEVAKLLATPVILVLDVGKMARSAAAVALGCRAFDPALNIAGVICNQVAGARHAAMVTDAITAIGLPVLGCIPRSAGLTIPERHLGLYTAVERKAEVAAFLKAAIAVLAAEVDLAQICAIARTAPALEMDAEGSEIAALARRTGSASAVRIAVARDEAFCFYYEDNLDLLRAAGAEIVPFSPLRDRTLPAGARGIYLGGGYPELHAADLAANKALLAELRAAGQAGMPIYAECGGLMYLTQGIADQAGVRHPMVGLLPGWTALSDQLIMGYRVVTAERDSLLLRRGEEVRGHEFHYSIWSERPAHLPAAYRIVPREGTTAQTEGYAEGNLLASYVHLHFGARPELAERFVQACLRWRNR
ncbi:MAG: cobyrinate a,c-diamide synthase [Anaerolineae bacterium]|nr:cobyrinate a,c-diamide synthase [Anaerolineae bacterium]MDW8100927.1 cobyrinate a,c-diamide synthase [Anaerolineae bacterium]